MSGIVGQNIGRSSGLIKATSSALGDNSVDSDNYVDASIDNAHLADDAVGVAELSATGTASSSTFLRGDNAWTAVAGFDATSITGQTDYTAIAPATGDTLVMYDTSASALREVTIASLGNTPAFKAKSTATQGSLDAGAIKFVFGAAIWDSHSAWDTTNSKFVVPANCAGKYMFSLTAYVYNIPTDGYFNVLFYVNGSVASNFSPSQGLRRTVASSNRESGWNVGVGIELAAADYVEVYGSKGWASGSPYHNYYSDCRFEGFRLGGV